MRNAGRVSKTQYQRMCAANNQAAHQDFFHPTWLITHISESHPSYSSKFSSQPNTRCTHLSSICLLWSCFSCRSCLYEGITRSSPVLSYIAPSPKPDQPPVLPYPSSPMQGVCPMITIKIFPPISESEYTNDGDEGSELHVNEGSVYARRTGFIGSPHGFVAPSFTFLSAFYISGSGGSTASSSTSTIIPHEFSASSALALSSSNSRVSGITVKAVVVNSTRVEYCDPDPERHRNENRVVSSRNPSDIDKIYRDGLMDVAF